MSSQFHPSMKKHVTRKDKVVTAEQLLLQDGKVYVEWTCPRCKGVPHRAKMSQMDSILHITNGNVCPKGGAWISIPGSTPVIKSPPTVNADVVV